MRAALIALLLIVGVASCGGDGDSGTGEEVEATTTTAATESSTTTTEPKGEESLFPPSVTAPVPSQGQPMADGIHAVYLEGVDVNAGTVTVDVIQFLTGEEADEAYREETGEDDDVPNDYFIRNASQDQRQVRVAGSISVTVAWDGDEVRQREMAFADLPDYLATRGVEGNDRAVFWVAVEYETVSELFEQYVP